MTVTLFPFFQHHRGSPRRGRGFHLFLNGYHIFLVADPTKSSWTLAPLNGLKTLRIAKRVKSHSGITSQEGEGGVACERLRLFEKTLQTYRGRRGGTEFAKIQPRSIWSRRSTLRLTPSVPSDHVFFARNVHRGGTTNDGLD
ncbi:hypothetical protein ARMSODRAFT_983590 [Armillaria solidipes]|uniref:Uncharacterized protein n=1 Tax=Armillaria solidipes TaxID=1076256 RepID=A0A2H3AV43_9AGAR|nr:hypothetical protein ARMSODRAFT_983590 [Armillaria solidipes]